jgi:hypothetical protein
MEAKHLKVIRHILMNTPAGEHKAVITDLQSILGSEVIQSEQVLQLLLEAISSHGASFHQDSKKWVINNLSKLTPVTYFDSKFEMQFEVNPFEMSLSNFVPFPYGNATSKALQGKLDEYLANHFSENHSGRVYLNGKDFVVLVNVVVTNFKNCWAGEFSAEWKIKGKMLKGVFSLKAHSFEEGNFFYSKNGEDECEIKSEEVAAQVDEIFNFIRETDLKFQKSFVGLSSEIPHKLFKPIRRTTAVNRSKYVDMNRHRMLKLEGS